MNVILFNLFNLRLNKNNIYLTSLSYYRANTNIIIVLTMLLEIFGGTNSVLIQKTPRKVARAAKARFIRYL